MKTVYATHFSVLVFVFVFCPPLSPITASQQPSRIMPNVVQEYGVWPANGLRWRDLPIVDPSRPWEVSPAPELVSLPPDAHAGNTRRSSTSSSTIVHQGVGAPRAVVGHKILDDNANPDFASKKKSKLLSLRFWKNRWSTKINRDNIQDTQHLKGQRCQATPAAFKAYGLWARPVFVGDVIVDNAYKDAEAGPSTLSRQQVEEIMRSLSDPDGTTHPERWIARVEHPSLPPRPSLWPTPPSSPRLPELPPSQIQLNPLLEHRVIGKSPIKLDIRAADQGNAELGDGPPMPEPSRTPQFFLLNTRGPNGGQPATYPGVTEMNIVALAEEPLKHFPWPFTIHARDGLPVTVQDVIFSVLINFAQFMSSEELEELDSRRRETIRTAYFTRLRQKRQWEEGEGIRRVDFLGERIMFRGLEPAPGGDGWMMFVGPHC